MEYLFILVVGAAIGGGIGFGIGGMGGKRNEGIGAVLGAVLGPLGWLIVALLPASGDGVSQSDKPAKPTEKERIAKLEAELAALKGAKKDLSDDGEIPTYKLD